MKEFKKGEVIFRQGDPGDCMYDILSGKVGVYAAYATPNEKLLTELAAGGFFGEMGLLDKAVRSATVVALEDTQVEVVTEADFNAFFTKNPEKVFRIMQQLSQRLRRQTEDYMEACRAIYEVVEAENKGKTRSKSLKAKLNEIFEMYSEFEQMHGGLIDMTWMI